MKQQYPGYLITFEGGEGCGKTSAIKSLIEWLDERGVNYSIYREPGGTEVGDEIRSVLLDFIDREMGPTDLAEVLLFQASRAQIVEQEILPALNRGKIVILDRYRDSSVAYQGFARGVGCTKIDKLNDISTQLLMPDLTILLDVDPKVGMQRRSAGLLFGEEWNRLDDMEFDFHKKVNYAFQKLAEFDDEGRWEIVDANAEQEIVLENVINIVENKLQKAGFIEGNRASVERR